MGARPKVLAVGRGRRDRDRFAGHLRPKRRLRQYRQARHQDGQGQPRIARRLVHSGWLARLPGAAMQAQKRRRPASGAERNGSSRRFAPFAGGQNAGTSTGMRRLWPKRAPATIPICARRPFAERRRWKAPSGKAARRFRLLLLKSRSQEPPGIWCNWQNALQFYYSRRRAGHGPRRRRFARHPGREHSSPARPRRQTGGAGPGCEKMVPLWCA